MGKGRKKGIVSLNTQPAKKQTNTADLMSNILSYKIPRLVSAFFRNDRGINLYIPTSVTKSHSGAGDENISLGIDISDSVSLTDSETLRAYASDDGAELTVNSIDYINNTANINHDTAEDIDIYFLPATGKLEINVYNPQGEGQSYKTIFSKTIRALHSIDQNASNSLLKLDTSWEALENHVLKVELKADWIVDYAPNDVIGQIRIPFTKGVMSKVTPEKKKTINRRYISL